MIIKRCRELALRAPARVVFPDALDQRVLKAAQYLHQQGLATPILVANPFELRQFALSHGECAACRITHYRLAARL